MGWCVGQMATDVDYSCGVLSALTALVCLSEVAPYDGDQGKLSLSSGMAISPDSSQERFRYPGTGGAEAIADLCLKRKAQRQKPGLADHRVQDFFKFATVHWLYSGGSAKGFA